jgi:hypothetical protein
VFYSILVRLDVETPGGWFSVAPSRHKHVLEKAVAPPRAPCLRRRVVPAAAALTLVTVGAGVATYDDPARSTSAITMSAPEVRTEPIPARVAPISRSEERVRLRPKPPEVTGRMFATDTVNVRAEPREGSRRVTTLEWAERVPVSGRTRGEWVEVVLDAKSRWVHGDFLSDTRPEPEPEPEPEEESHAPTGPSQAPCPSSGVESGLVPNAVAVHRAICNAFPQITSYGGVRADSGSHGTGRAIDAMVSGSLGWEVAEYVRANAGSLGVSEVLFSQKIWTVERSSEGWRSMESRGSATADHYDHVHVTVY